MALISLNVAAGNEDNIALIDERTQLSWRAVDGLLNRATNGILQQVGDGRRPGVFSRNCAESVLAYVAALAAGREGVAINSQLAAGELAYILEDGAVDLLFTGPESLDAAQAAVRQVGRGEIVAWRCAETPGVTGWDAWLAAQADSEPPGDIPAVTHLHYTSGTTGRPKAVRTPPTMFPAAATVADLFTALGQEVRAGVSGPGLAVAPLYHTSPLRLVRAFAGGAPLVTLGRFDAEETLATIERHRIERSVMVPTHFRRLLALPAATRAHYDVSSLKLVSHTGAACAADVKEQMIAWFGPILLEFYGGTETGPAAKIDSHEALAHPGSVGRAAPPYEAVIIGEDGKELPPGREGALYFRDTSGRGIEYVNDPEKTRSAHIAPGVFTLGDVGYVDDEGYIFITDRASDMIVSGGVNIYPAEIETAIGSHPAIEDVAVIGVPDADMGEQVKALIVLRPGAAPPGAAALDSWCRERLAGFKCPRSWEIVESVGRTGMGKINKRALRAPYWPTDRTIG